MLTFGPRAAHAEVAAADPIDASMRACLARADMSSTVGQVQCMGAAQAGWQRVVDTTYPELLAKSPAARRKGWEQSQRRWLAWHEVEMPLLGAVFATTSGTMYMMFQADMELQPVRDRALALRSALADAGQGSPPRPRACSADTQCAHADRDINRYYRRLRAKMPEHSRVTLVRAEQAWVAFRDATTPLVDSHGRNDLIGARVATLKRLGEAVGND